MSDLITRNRSPLAILIDPATDIPLTERDIRLEDYLNDKIQTVGDLGNLASLLENVENQTKLLEEQHVAAKAAFAESKNASSNYASQMRQRAQEFEKQQVHIQKRLMIVTASDTPEEAAARLKGPMEKLRRVELARSYVELLKDVDDLTKEARSHLPANPKEALKPYTHLKELSISLEALQEQAEGAAVHLVSHVEHTTSLLWEQMKKIMTDEFESVLKRSNWPDTSVELTREWMDCFERLLDLQSPEILSARGPLILLPMGVLTEHFRVNFYFHFFTEKSTNKPHNLGQYFFPWFLGTVEGKETFLRENVAPILAAYFRGNELAGNTLYIDPVSGFITALLPVLKEKIDSLLPQIGREPELLSKFVAELLEFDEAVRHRFSYDGGNPDYGWKGLTWDVLNSWFDQWSLVEKKFALQRYQNIIKTSDAGELDYDAPHDKTKTTYGAAKVTDLISNVTASYDKLRKFSHKVRFLINIQAEILDQYLGRLKDSLEAFQAATSTVGRTLHGVTKEQQAALEGVGGLESLCKVFGSAEHLIVMLKEWSNEAFFIQLWDELQERAKTTSADSNLAGSMTYTEVKDVTSGAVGSEQEGSVFDVTIDGYERVRDRAESLMIQSIKYSFPTIFKQYLTKPQWTTIGEVPASISDLAVSAELDLPLQTLKQYLTFLHRALSAPIFKRISRASLSSLQDLLLNDILLKQDFTTLGSARLSQDLSAIQNIVNSYPGTDQLFPKLAQGIKLLSLPIEGAEGEVTVAVASKAIYSTAASTEELLARLGLGLLTNYEARCILQRRVEAND